MSQNRKNAMMIGSFLLCAALIFALAVFCRDVYITSLDALEVNIAQRLDVTSEYVREMVTAEFIEEFTEPEHMEKPEYEQLRSQLQSMAEEMDVAYIYIVRPLPNGLGEYVFDSDPDESTRMQLGDTSEAPMEGVLLTALEKGKTTHSSLGEYAGEWIGLMTSYTPIFDETGKAIACVGVDIYDEQVVKLTENMNLFSKLLLLGIIVFSCTGTYLLISAFRATAAANKANRSKSEFLSRMSHEIRTPLTAIIGVTEMARQAEDIEISRQHLNIVQDNSKHLLSLINDILDLSKIESGKIVFISEPFQLEDELKNVCDIVMPPLKQKQQSFRMEIDEGLRNISLKGDRIKFNQININLLSNAIKFTQEEGEIQFLIKQLKMDEKEVLLEVEVRDNGPGISLESQKRIFEAFEQEHTGNTRVGGTGLGLSIAKRFLTMMGGTIQLSSEQGKGTSFCYKVPFEIGAFREMPASSNSNELNLSGKQFLIAEDVEINRVIIEDILTEAGAQVDFAENGQLAVELFSVNPEKYDIVFMDIQMPVMDGYRATRMIRQSDAVNAKIIPILSMTANVFKEEVELAQEAGMTGHIAKPFIKEDIFAELERVIYPYFVGVDT